MKKLLSFALILMVCCTSALLFAGCDGNQEFIQVKGTVAAITLPSQDVLNDLNLYDKLINAELEKIDLELYDKDPNKGGTLQETLKLSQARQQGAHISNFTLKTKGKRTATISFNGATTTFEYEVK